MFYFLLAATNNTVSGTLRIVNRRTWLAQPPVKRSNPLQHPVKYVVILHTATETCSTQADCVFIVRNVQTYHIESYGWNDIGYSFLVGGDGSAYEGRGWDTEGAFALGYNKVAIGIAFIGTFTSDLPVPKQIQAAKQLIDLGVKNGAISPDYKLLAHRQLSPTESPGLAFFEQLQTWPHWAKTP
jgi:N-acetylmuramoyl-L-alanine amidase